MAKNPKIEVDYKVVNAAFNKGITEIKGEVTSLNKSFALQKEQMKLSATESEKLEANIDKLNKEYESAQKQTRLVESGYNNVVEIMGEASKEAQTWSNKLLDAQKNEQYLENSIKEKTDALIKSNEATKKAAEEQAKLETNTKRFDTLLKATDKTLDDYVDVLGTRMVQAIRDGEASSDQLELAINKIGKSAIGTEGDLSELKRTLDRVDDGDSIDEVRDEIKNMGQAADETSPKIDEMTDALRADALMEAAGIMKDISDGIIDIGKEAIETAANAQARDAQFEQVFGEAESVATEAVDVMAEAFGILPNRLKQPFTTTTSMFLGLGIDIDESMLMAADAIEVAADSAAFYDRSLDETQGSLNSFLKGNYEGGEAIGLFANETQIAAYAIKNNLIEATEEQKKHADASAIAVEKAQVAYSNAAKKYGESSLEARDAQNKLNDAIEKQEAGPNLTAKWSKLTEAQKQSVRLNYAKEMQAQSGAVGQAAREADGYENVMGNLDAIISEFMETIGEPALEMFLDLVQELIPLIESVANWFRDLNPGVKEFITIILGITAAVGALMPIILAIKGAMLLFGASFALIIAAAIAVISAIVYAIMNWDQIMAVLKQTMADWGVIFRNIWDGIYQFGVGILTNISTFFGDTWNNIKDSTSEVWDGVKTYLSEAWTGIKESASETWEGIKTAITEPFTRAYESIKGVVENIKGALSGIKAPSIVRTGSNKILGLEIPTFGIQWNARGGIFKKPTVIGSYGGSMQGVGEAGDEAVIPLSRSVLASIGAGISQTMDNNEVLERLDELIDLEYRLAEKETRVGMTIGDRQVAEAIFGPLSDQQEIQDKQNLLYEGAWT